MTRTRYGLTRRDAIGGAAASAALLLTGWRHAVAGGVSADTAIAALLAGREARPSGRISLDVPASFDQANTVPLGVSVDSAMTAEAYVRRVDMFADGNPLPEIATAHFASGGGPARLSTRFRLDKGNHLIRAYAELNDGSIITASREIMTASDGCGGKSAIAPGEAAPVPVPRIGFPERAARGEIIDVASMISHRMESGFRTDTAGNPLPRRIVNRMECHYAGRMVFAADLTPAVAANAYLKFPLMAVETGEVAFAWFEDGGAVYRTTRQITVA